MPRAPRQPRSFRVARKPPPKVRRRYRLRFPAYIYMLVTVFIAIGAFNSQNNLLFWAFGLSLSAMVVSGVLSGTMLMGIEIERRALADARAGERLALAYTVRNRNRWVPAFAMRLEEIPPTRVWWSRRTANADPWTSHIDRPIAFVPHVGPGEAVTARVDVPALRRGRVRLIGVRLISTFPFGLIRKTVEFLVPEEAVITPALILPPDNAADLLGRTGDAAIASRRQGPGDEFFALREYIPGDSPRSIAWRASARRMHMDLPGPGGGLLVKQNASPAPARLWIVLRLVPSKAAATDNETAISLAVGLASQSLDEGLSVGIAVPRASVTLRPLPGAPHLHTIARELGVLDLSSLDQHPEAGRFPAAAAAPGSIIAVIHAGAADRSFGPGHDRVAHLTTTGVQLDLDHAAQLARAPRQRDGQADGPGGKAGA